MILNIQVGNKNSNKLKTNIKKIPTKKIETPTMRAC